MVLYRLAFAFSLMMPPPPRPTLFPYTTLFRSMLASFDPDALEQKFERFAKRGGLLGGATKQRYWELYRDIFQEMAGDADDSFRTLFGKAFGEGYERQARLLKRGPQGQ